MVPHIMVPALITFLGIIDKKFVNGISVSQKKSGINTGIMLIPLITKNTSILPSTSMYNIYIFIDKVFYYVFIQTFCRHFCSCCLSIQITKRKSVDLKNCAASKVIVNTHSVSHTAQQLHHRCVRIYTLIY